MEIITLIVILLIASSVFTLAYISINNYNTVKKLDKKS
jgi:hypothetical protein